MTLNIKLTPITQLFIATILGILWTSAILYTSTHQPYLGIQFAPEEQHVIIQDITENHASLPTHVIGQQLEHISSAQQSVTLEAFDLTIEPDSAMGTYKNYQRFLERQQQLSEILRQPEVHLTLADGTDYLLKPQPTRPLSTLGSSFWVQLSVGVIAWLIAAAVFAFRPKELSARYLLLSGFSTLVFSTFAGIYTTRELALPATLFQFLSDSNFLGGSIYCACFMGLLLYYPRRLAATWVGIGVIIVYLLWFIAQQYGLFESMSFARRFLVVTGLLCSLTLAMLHWQSSKQNPVTRAALQWFLMSWSLGIGLFIVIILLPTLFGVDTSALQGYAFLLVLMVFIGLAFGILRYRLFELGVWWGRIILLLLGILALCLMDIAILTLLNFSPQLSLTLSLLLVGLLWLPLRGWIWEKFLGYLTPKPKLQFQQIINIALAPHHLNHSLLWKDFLQENFATLEAEITAQHVDKPSIDEHGLALVIPPVHHLKPVVLRYAVQGRRLFSPQDMNATNELIEMLSYALEARHAYETGVMTERQRISRDLHDNIGSQLITALHNEQPQHKDEVIQNTLTDLRDIINNTLRGGLDLDEFLANMRLEGTQRLDIAGLNYEWTVTGDTVRYVPLHLIHELRSVIREAINNIIRHAQAKHVNIAIHVDHEQLTMSVQDDGQGLSDTTLSAGQGLLNMQTRITQLGGTIVFSNPEIGLKIDIVLPLSHTVKEQA